MEPLSVAAVCELAAPYDLDGPEIHRVTGGNPFFVTEVLAEGGGDIPATVRDAVLARTARLSDAATAVLEAVSVALPQAELWLLDALVPDGRRAAWTKVCGPGSSTPAGTAWRSGTRSPGSPSRGRSRRTGRWRCTGRRCGR